MLDEFQRLPVEFDRRDRNREARLVAETLDGRPAVLVSLNSVSSPIQFQGFVDRLKEELPDCQIVDMGKVRAERLYDVLGLLDKARLLVTVDSSLLHLSRGSACPVWAITNDGWKGSVLPPGAIGGCRYAETSTGSLLQATACAVWGILRPRRVFCVTDAYWPDERHEKARAMIDSIPRLRRLAADTTGHRNATDIGHNRKLPYLKEVLKVGLNASGPGDVILWTNPDCGLLPGIVEWAERMAPFEFVTMRRDTPHCGRDLCLFTHEWLRDNFDEIPDFILGGPIFDLQLATWARYRRGIKSRMDTLGVDFLPCDAQERLCTHAEHAQNWDNGSATAKWNGRLFGQWIKHKAPDLGWVQ
jgi:hypothetical protein